MVNLTITNGTIIESGVNYARITGNGVYPGTVLSGRPYIDSQNSVVINSEDIIVGTPERVEKIENGYLIDKNISQITAQRLYNYYLRQNVYNIDFLTNGGSLDRIGDIIQAVSIFDEDSDIVGQIEKLTLHLGDINIKAKGVIRGE